MLLLLFSAMFMLRQGSLAPGQHNPLCLSHLGNSNFELYILDNFPQSSASVDLFASGAEACL